MLTLTSPVETPFHRLPAGGKLAALALFGLLLFALRGPWWQTGMLGAVILLYLPGGRLFILQGLRMARPLWPFLLVLAAWHLWSGDLLAGLTIALRLIAAVATANLVTMTTRLADMLALIERLCRPLSPLIPPRRLALAFALSIRFIPVMGERAALLRQAWRARSPRRPGRHILTPMVIAALDDADHAAEALRARGGVD